MCECVLVYLISTSVAGGVGYIMAQLEVYKKLVVTKGLTTFGYPNIQTITVKHLFLEQQGP